MHAFIRIGDTTLSIVEGNYLGDDGKEFHVATMQDTFTQKDTEGQMQTAVLPNEVAACNLVMDFMEIDGPKEDSIMQALFPKFCPNILGGN